MDIGAGGGIDPRWKKFTSYYKAILFEPDPREYEILKPKNEKNLILLNSALSDSVNTVHFNLCRNQRASAVYLPNLSFLSKFPICISERFDVTSNVVIKTDTLNNQLRQNDITEIDFIKIDAQGSELSILKGSLDYLDKVIGLELEVEFAPLYENQPLFNDVDSLVRKNNFELFDIKRSYWKRKEGMHYGERKGQLVFADALYFKSPEHIVAMNNIAPEKIIRSICIYLVYGYPDLAQTLFTNADSKRMLSKEIHGSIVTVLSKFKERIPLPEFKGKWKIEGWFKNIANMFASQGWYSGTDEFLGNP